MLPFNEYHLNEDNLDRHNSLKSCLGTLLKSWLGRLVSGCINPWDDRSPEINFDRLPLKRSRLNRSPDQREHSFLYPRVNPCLNPVINPATHSAISASPIIYQSALFPWLASVFPDRGDLAFWEAQITPLLPHWQHQELALDLELDLELELELAIVPRHGLKIGVSGIGIVSILKRWLQDPALPQLPQPVQRQILAKTGDGCELHYHHDRCGQLQALGQHQGWWPSSLPWQDLTWENGFEELWITDPTARSLLETWIDQTDALDGSPPHLVTGIPNFLKHLSQYDRAHAWGALAQTLPQNLFWAHSALLAASDRLLSGFIKVLTVHSPFPY